MRPDIRALATLLAVLASVLLLLSPHSAEAALRLADEQARYDLIPGAELVVDEENNLTISDIAGGQQPLKLSHSDRPQINFGIIGRPVWLRAEIQNRHPTLHRWILDTRSGLDLVQLYVRNDHGGFTERRAGNLVPHLEWNIRSSRPAFALEVPPGESREIYLRYQNSGHLGIRPVVASELRFARDTQTASYIFGLYYGAMLVMALYNLFLFFSIRERVYLVYVLFIVAATLMQMSIDGFAHQYLWPASSASRAMVFFVGLASLFSIEFTRLFLRLKEHSPRTDLLLRVAAGGSAAYLLVVLFGSLPASMKLANVLGIVFFGATVTSMVDSLRNGRRSPRYFAVAWSAMAFGVDLTTLKN
jgi:two-component system, sensor histidine kinase LadS